MAIDIEKCATEVHLPALHDAANKASRTAQRSYLSLMRLNLIALLVGAIAGAVALPSGVAGQVIAGIAAVALVAALLITFMIQDKAYERTWYGGRAVAESVKTLAWRYMACSEPFDTPDPADADALFLARLSEILKYGSTLSVNLSTASGEQISGVMRKVRGSALPERREVYVRCRIVEQRDWYSSKAALSEVAERKFFAAVWLSNGAAVVAAVMLVIWPTVPINATGVFATAAASALAWLQVRRHQEIAQSYAIAAQELGIVEAKSLHVKTESEFVTFVADAENAISREHTLWVARRDAGITTTLR